MRWSDILVFLAVVAAVIFTISNVGLPMTEFRSEHVIPLISQSCPNALSGTATGLEEGLTVVGELWKCAIGVIVFMVVPGVLGFAFLFLKWFFSR
ncbi:MAG: hypothetical protein SVV03_05030 [Candidatus Nanohaloarchaea archaeon]|nr:hypothetical protein [Candidatus Nanohaloarchaea archaeon]